MIANNREMHRNTVANGKNRVTIGCDKILNEGSIDPESWLHYHDWPRSGP